MRGAGPHEAELNYDIVLKHSCMLYTDLIEYNFVGDIEAPLLHWFLFFSNHKAGVIETAGEFMKYQTFSNLQFRTLLKFIFFQYSH